MIPRGTEVLRKLHPLVGVGKNTPTEQAQDIPTEGIWEVRKVLKLLKDPSNVLTVHFSSLINTRVVWYPL